MKVLIATTFALALLASSSASSEEWVKIADMRSSVANLYDQYASYCRSSGKHPRSKVQFGKTLTNSGYEQVRDSRGRHWQGLTTFVIG